MYRIRSLDRTPLKITQGDAALSSLCSSPSLNSDYPENPLQVFPPKLNFWRSLRSTLKNPTSLNRDVIRNKSGAPRRNESTPL